MLILSWRCVTVNLQLVCADDTVPVPLHQCVQVEAPDNLICITIRQTGYERVVTLATDVCNKLRQPPRKYQEPTLEVGQSSFTVVC